MIPDAKPITIEDTIEQTIYLEPSTPKAVVEYLLETEKPISNTEYANLIQLVFNKTVDLLSAVHTQNNLLMADVNKLLVAEGAIIAEQYIYPTLVYALRQSVDISK